MRVKVIKIDCCKQLKMPIINVILMLNDKKFHLFLRILICLNSKTKARIAGFPREKKTINDCLIYLGRYKLDIEQTIIIVFQYQNKKKLIITQINLN